MSSPEKDIAYKFYTGFSEKNVDILDDLYDQTMQFSDPAFGNLDKNETIAMWKMLFTSSDDLEVTFNVIDQIENMIQVEWIATYSFGKQKRKVVNRIIAELTIEGGKIIKHTDKFNLHKWAGQALGLTGFLIGWTSFFRKKLHRQTHRQLKKIMSKSD